MPCHWGRCLWWGCVDDGRSTNLALPDLVHDLYLFNCFVYCWRVGPESWYSLHFVQIWSSKNILKHSCLHTHIKIKKRKYKQCPIYFPLNSRSTAPAAHDMSLRSMSLIGMRWRWKEHELSPTWFSSWVVCVLWFCVFLTLWARKRLFITLCTEVIFKQTY